MVLRSEFIGGAKLIKATATEDRVIREFGERIEELRVNHTWATFLPGVTKGGIEFISIIALCFILVVGHLYFNTPASQLLLLLALFVRLLPRFNALQQNIQLLNTYLPAFIQVGQLERKASEKAERMRQTKEELPALKGQLHVSVQSAGFQGISILKDVELEIPEKGFIGIVGESGAGKSTLIHLLLNLCELYKGDVKIGSTSDMSRRKLFFSTVQYQKTSLGPMKTLMARR